MLELDFFGDGPFTVVLDEVLGLVPLVFLQVRFCLFLFVFPCFINEAKGLPLVARQRVSLPGAWARGVGFA